MTDLQIRDNRESGYFKIDTILVKEGWAKAMGVYGLAVYNVLACMANNDSQAAFPKYETIAELAGCSRRVVVDMIADLEAGGLISVEERWSDKGRTSNLITLLHREVWHPPEIITKFQEERKQKGRKCKSAAAAPNKQSAGDALNKSAGDALNKSAGDAPELTPRSELTPPKPLTNPSKVVVEAAENFFKILENCGLSKTVIEQAQSTKRLKNDTIIFDSALATLNAAGITSPAAIAREIAWRREEYRFALPDHFEIDLNRETHDVFDQLADGVTGPPAAVLDYLKERAFTKTWSREVVEACYTAGIVHFDDIADQVERQDADLIRQGKTDPAERARLIRYRIVEEEQFLPPPDAIGSNGTGKAWYTAAEFADLIAH